MVKTPRKAKPSKTGLIEIGDGYYLDLQAKQIVNAIGQRFDVNSRDVETMICDKLDRRRINYLLSGVAKAEIIMVFDNDETHLEDYKLIDNKGKECGVDDRGLDIDDSYAWEVIDRSSNVGEGIFLWDLATNTVEHIGNAYYPDPELVIEYASGEPPYS